MSLALAIENAENAALAEEANNYLNANMEAISNAEATLEEVTAILSKMKGYITQLSMPADYTSATDESPVDVTSVIVNPSYEDANSDGWSGSVPNHSSYNRTDMVEYWRSSFDHYQTIAALPAGTYELSLHCYSRYQDNAQDDLNALEEGKKDEVMSAFVYAKVGDKTFAEPFRLIAEGARVDNTLISGSCSTITNAAGETLYTPNNMTTAGACFEETDEEGNPLSDEMNYLVRVVFTLDEAADVTIGCKNDDAADWNIWDDWKLTYFGTNSSKTDSGDAVAIEGIDAAPAKANGKYFENGRIIIVKNGVKYNVAGQMVK